MAIKLLRESSETPNISNKDDVKMIRYAYGGYDGIIQSYGEKLAATVTGSSLRIGSGRVVVNGWEVDIDGAGVTLDLSHMSSGVYYYTVYLEVNAELETVEVKTLYDTAEYPRVSVGDDLTEAQSGTAALELYHFIISSGNISNVERVCILIPYGKQDYEGLDNALKSFQNTTTNKFTQVDSQISSHTSQISSIESRLSILGFRQGSCSVSGGSPQVNSLKRQGKYVIMDLVINVSGTSFTAYIPSGYRPKSSVPIYGVYSEGASKGGYFNVSISTSGVIRAGTGSFRMGFVYLRNIGWETADS